MDHKRKLLIKTVKKLCLATNILKVFNWICPLLLLADFVLFLIFKTNVNIALYISLIIAAIILTIVNLILYYQIKYYKEVKEYLQQIIFNEEIE